MKQFLIYIASIALLLGFANCKKENNNPEPPAPEPEKILIGEEYAIGSGLKVYYYAIQDPFVGYNKVYLSIKDSISGESISDSISLNMMPIMNMGTMQHSCPIETLQFENETKQFIGAITYVMPSTSGVWTISVSVNNYSNGLSGEAIFTIDVIEPEEAKLTSFISDLDSNASYFISLIRPKNPEVGENDFEILINRKASMMDWPYEPYLSVEIDPQMPSMNHGSPNNVNPSHIGNGHYKGVCNFTMTGWWRINMTIKDGEGSVLKDDVYLDITF